MTRRFDDIQPEELPQVMREAVRLQEVAERERESQLGREAYADAAQELGISRTELDRAAAEHHAATIAQVRRKRKMRNGAIAAAAGALLMAGGYRAANPPAPDPTSYTFEQPAQTWAPELNPKSAGHAGQEGGRGVIVVDRFTPEDDGRYWANLNSPSVPPSLDGHRTVTLRIRGEGTLSQARLFLENGPTERWRSPAIPTGPEWRVVTIRLDQMEHQTRRDTRSPWQGDGRGAPDEVTGVSIKVGHPFNPPDARGRVEVDDLRIE